MTLERRARKCGDYGFDGPELACWGGNEGGYRALSEACYAGSRWAILPPNDPNFLSIPTRLDGRTLCNPIYARDWATLPPEVWGDDPAGARTRAASVKHTARASARFGVVQAYGFTGTKLRHQIYSSPPKGFAERWNPTIRISDEQGARQRSISW